jgi:peptidyl-prolyl cis-trans isomerase SurA
MERLVVEKIQLQICERMGMSVDDETLNRAIAEIASNNGVDVDQFREILEQENYSYGSFREQIRHQMMISELTQREVASRVVVSPSEIDDFLDNQVFQGESDLNYHISHILISTSEKDTPEQIAAARAKADTLLQQARNGAEFAELAKAGSDAQQAADGGDLGWRKAGELPTLFADFITRAEIGAVSDVIASDSGFHIVKLVDRRTGEQIMVDQTKARHILIKTNELITEEDARTRLAQLRLRLEGGDDFAALARTHSDDRASALEGGDLGWVSPGQMVPEFEQVMKQTPTGSISRPFESEFGWHILQVLDRRSYDGTEEVQRARARSVIHQRKSEEEQQSWLRRLRDEAYVEFRLLSE